ncbi:MAG: hypothetical protein LBT11_02390 [Treponema sp.]|nr:hypothetical protein [Treponema sp.]
MGYAKNHRSPNIEIEPFLVSLINHATRWAPEKPEWERWAKDSDRSFRSELAALVEQGKCQILIDGGKNRIFMTGFLTKTIAAAYETMDRDTDIPFPGEESLGIEIPPAQMCTLHLQTELPAYLDDPQQNSLPVLQLILRGTIPSFLALPNLVPRRLLEAAILKIRSFLRGHSNRDYFQHRMMSQLSGRDTLLRETLHLLDSRPMDIVQEIEVGNEFAGLFWLYFCSLVKMELGKKNELLAQDIAALQSVCIVEVLSAYFKARAVRQKAHELALEMLEVKLGGPPYYFSREDIIGFTDSSGKKLLDQYSRKELEEYLKTRTTESRNQELPVLLIFRDQDSKPLFVSKTRLLPLCTKLLRDLQPRIRKGILERWMKLIRDFRTEAAMETSQAFESLVQNMVRDHSATLSVLLGNNTAYLVQEELMRKKRSPAGAKLFDDHGGLLPLGRILGLDRKDLLRGARIMLPFWYSMPIIVPLITFFKRGNKKGQEKATGAQREGQERSGEPNVLLQYKQELIPQGYSLDSYIEELEQGWQKLMKQDALEALKTDIKSLVKTRLRKFLELQHHRNMTRESVNDLAGSLMNDTPAIRELGNRESMYLYVRLLILKYIPTIKI